MAALSGRSKSGCAEAGNTKLNLPQRGRTFTLNAPVEGSPTGARTIITGTQKGTYTMNCDGTGTITRTLTSSTGVVTTQTDDFLITKATERDGHLLATGLEDMTRVPSAPVPGDLFVFRSYTRRPD